MAFLIPWGGCRPPRPPHFSAGRPPRFLFIDLYSFRLYLNAHKSILSKLTFCVDFYLYGGCEICELCIVFQTICSRQNVRTDRRIISWFSGQSRFDLYLPVKLMLLHITSIFSVLCNWFNSLWMTYYVHVLYFFYNIEYCPGRMDDM